MEVTPVKAAEPAPTAVALLANVSTVASELVTVMLAPPAVIEGTCARLNWKGTWRLTPVVTVELATVICGAVTVAVPERYVVPFVEEVLLN